MTVTVTMSKMTTKWKGVPRMDLQQIDKRVPKRDQRRLHAKTILYILIKRFLLGIYSWPPGELIQFIPKI